MQIQRINNSQNFQGHGAKRFSDIMNRLYKDAYKGGFLPEEIDVIQLTSKMNDGVEVSAIANFLDGKFIGLKFPYCHVKYKSQFCNKLFEIYNNAVTKGKGNKIPRW